MPHNKCHDEQELSYIRTCSHISLIEYLSHKLENHIYQHNLSRFQKIKLDLQSDLDDFHFGGFENSKHQRNSATLMTQFPTSITLYYFIF